MVSVKGGGLGKRVIAQLPAQIERKLLRGAARAAATVIADDAKERLGARQAEVEGGAKVTLADTIKVKTRRTATGVVAKIKPEGPGTYVLPWLEYGTSPHFISVDDSQRQGRTAGRINRLEKGGSTVIAGARRVNKEGEKGSLVIGGQFVGTTVHHPGARPHPFLRVALDSKQAEAVAAAQAFINSRITPAGITGSEEPEGEDA